MGHQGLAPVALLDHMVQAYPIDLMALVLFIIVPVAPMGLMAPRAPLGPVGLMAETAVARVAIVCGPVMGAVDVV